MIYGYRLYGDIQDSAMANFLITGGAGFIGSNLVGHLLDAGHRVRVVDDCSTGTRDNLADMMDKIDLHAGDIRDADLMNTLTRDMDYICHLAAIVSVQQSIDDPLLTNDINITGTLNVLEAARKNGIKRVVFSSSCAVYGDQLEKVCVETMVPRPMSPYAATKIIGEHYCKAYTVCFGLETVSLRYFNVFGQRQNLSSDYAAVIPRFIAAIGNDKQPVIFGDGYQSRDFIHVENVCRANILAATSNTVGKGEVLNIASGNSCNLRELLDIIKSQTGKEDIQPRFEPARKGDVRHSAADIRYAVEQMKYGVTVDFHHGLHQTIHWFQNREQS